MNRCSNGTRPHGLEGRYRVLEVIDGAGPGLIRGRTIYGRPVISLFSTPLATNTLLPVRGAYAVGRFHMLAIDPQDRRLVLPQRSARCSFCANAGRVKNNPGGPLRVQDEESLAWDARGLDDQGRTICRFVRCACTGFRLDAVRTDGAAVAQDRQKVIVQAVRLVPCGGVVFYASVSGNSATSTGCATSQTENRSQLVTILWEYLRRRKVLFGNAPFLE